MGAEILGFVNYSLSRLEITAFQKLDLPSDEVSSF
jgi:hypothetical protein